MQRNYWIIIGFISSLLLPSLLCAQQKPRLDFHIKGISGDLLKNAETVLTNAKGKDTLTDDIIHDLYRQGPQYIEKALQPFGYFRITVKSSLTHSDRHWIAQYTINLGPALKVSRLHVEIKGAGHNDPAFLQFLANLPLKKGEPFNTKKYEAIKQALFSIANNNGYLDARLSQKKLHIDLQRYEAIIHLQLQTGPRFYFGNINVAANFFAPDFIRRFARFQPGDVYSNSQLLDYQSKLNNSGYFNNIVIQPEKAKASKKHHVPLAVKISPVKAQRWLFSGGYGTDTGARGAVGWQWRRITAGGQHLTTNISYAQLIGVNLGATYSIPGRDPITEQYTATANFYNFDTNAGKYFSQNYALNYLTSYPHWHNSYSLIFINETYTPSGEQKQRAHLLMPSTSFVYLVTDNPVRPKFGTRTSLNIRGASKSVLSSTDFAQVRLDFKWIQPLLRSNRLVTETSLGATYSSDFNLVPLSLRFTAGGATSVRGYAFQSLGPGKYLATGSIEFQQRVYGDFYLGAFYDVGNAFNQPKKISPLLNSATGLGVIWDSPVGNLELSIARTLGPNKPRYSVQFSMGSLL